MRSRGFAPLIAAVLFAAALPLIAEQPLPPPPAGFRSMQLDDSLQALKDSGQGDMVVAEKASDASCADGARTTFRYGWQVPTVGFDKTWELWKQTPEEPAQGTNAMGIRDEPAGKDIYKDGILEWRKVTRVTAASCADEKVTYRGSWTGYLSGKLIVLRVENVVSLATGQAWIDAYLDKVVAVAVGTAAKPRTPGFVERYIPTGFSVDDRTSVTQYLGAYKLTRVAAQRPNHVPKPFVSPEDAKLNLTYMQIVDPSYATLMWQQAQNEAEKDSQNAEDERTFLGKETLANGGTIYWYQEDSLQYLPRRLRSAAGEKPSLAIYDATIIRKLDEGLVKVEITDYVGEQKALRQWYTRQ